MERKLFFSLEVGDEIRLMIQNHISTGRFHLVFLTVLMAFCVLFGRLYVLHVSQADQYAGKIEKLRKSNSIIEARRGNILDRQGHLIATTRPRFTLAADPFFVDLEKTNNIKNLAKILYTDPGSITTAINNCSSSYVVIDKNLDEEQYEAAKKLSIKGILLEPHYERAYSGNQMAAHVVGYLNKENVPCIGIEKSMNYYLEGQDGSRQTERDGRRRELAQFRNREVAPKNGMDVQLTLDVSIQSAVEEELDRIVREFQPQGATVIVSEPSTGYILGIGNRPTFDPNKFWEYDIKNQRNLAITDIYEPGSVFKVVTVSAALNEGVVTPEREFDCDIAKVRYRGKILKLPSDHDPLGIINVHKIVSQSSNRGAAHLGMMLGERRLYEYSRAFGFGKKTGFLMGGEVNGILHPVKRWDGLTITRLPMGHAISATPMQVHNSISCIANDGVLMSPQIVRRVLENGEQVVSFEPQQLRRVISVKTAVTMSKMLAKVVAPGGTATRARIEGYQVAGKTGTTQKIVNGRYVKNAHVASFVGYFPAENPRVVMTVVVDEPIRKGVGYGGVVAAPAFQRIGKEVIRYLGMEPIESQDKGIASLTPNSNFYSSLN